MWFANVLIGVPLPVMNGEWEGGLVWRVDGVWRVCVGVMGG